MTDVLSQEEIDALLQSASESEATAVVETTVDGRTPVSYDFKHPNRVSKDQIRTLENVHTSFAGHLGSALSGSLRAVVDVDLVSVDQFTYSEFVMSLAWPSCTYKILLSPLEGQCLADFSPSLCLAFVDRMFGGRGRVIEVERELSGIERSIMDGIAARALKELSQAWKRIYEVAISIEGFESTPQFIQIVPPGETVIVTTFQVKLLSMSGIVTLCYPYLTLEPIMEHLSGQTWIDASKAKADPEARGNLETSLQTVETNLTAVLATAKIPMREFLSVKVNDVIVTDTKASEPTRILVGGVEKFRARPGIHGRYRAIEIVSATTDGESQ